jgi:hypothetical protein
LERPLPDGVASSVGAADPLKKEVKAMKRVSKKARECCVMEKENLVAALQKCDWCSTSYEEFSQCYQAAATEIGERSRACLVT